MKCIQGQQFYWRWSGIVTHGVENTIRNGTAGEGRYSAKRIKRLSGLWSVVEKAFCRQPQFAELQEIFFQTGSRKRDSEGKHYGSGKYILKRILIKHSLLFSELLYWLHFYSEYGASVFTDDLLWQIRELPGRAERKRVALGLDQPVIIRVFYLVETITWKSGFLPTAPRDRWQR